MRATDHRRDATENHWVHVSKSGVAEQRVVFFQVLSLVSWNASRPWAYQCTPLDLVARVHVKSGYFNIYSPVRYTYSSVLRKYLTFKDFFVSLVYYCCFVVYFYISYVSHIMCYILLTFPSLLCIDELQRANLDPGDTEQVIHQLHSELLEAQELANTGKQKCLELQGAGPFLLKPVRFLSAVCVALNSSWMANFPLYRMMVWINRF